MSLEHSPVRRGDTGLREGRSDGTSTLLRDGDVERMLGLGKGWCAKDRLGQARIPFIKIGRSVRYRPADVEAFIEASVRKSTSDCGQSA